MSKELIINDIALKVAKGLLEIKAVKLRPEEPFTWASGWKSPIYCDNRVTLSYPELRTFIKDAFVSLIKSKFSDVDVIAGVATGGIPQGVLIAQELEKPFVYIRSTEKAHGMENKVEGKIESGQTVVVVEDLISTGGSSLKAVQALRDAGCEVKGMVAIFEYGFQLAEDKFKEKNVEYHTLTNYTYLIEQALNDRYIGESQVNTLKEWRKNPSEWRK